MSAPNFPTGPEERNESFEKLWTENKDAFLLALKETSPKDFAEAFYLNGIHSARADLLRPSNEVFESIWLRNCTKIAYEYKDIFKKGFDAALAYLPRADSPEKCPECGAEKPGHFKTCSQVF